MQPHAEEDDDRHDGAARTALRIATASARRPRYIVAEYGLHLRLQDERPAPQRLAADRVRDPRQLGRRRSQRTSEPGAVLAGGEHIPRTPCPPVPTLLARIRATPEGFVRAYGDVSPGAPRFAGAVLSECDDPSVPWHRIVRADGSLAKGARQRALLEAEGVPFRRRARRHARGPAAGLDD